MSRASLRSGFRSLFAYGIGHSDAAEDFIEPALFGVQFFDVPAVGGFGDAARQRAVGILAFRKDAGGYAGGLLLENGGALDGRQLDELGVQSGGVDASYAEGDSPR